MIVPVILSGGAGTRLWPLSTPEKPKQFLPLVTDRTLFQDTLLRLDGIAGLAAPIVLCNEAHRFLVAEQLREIDLTARAIVLERAARNTAPAIAVAAALVPPDAVLLVLPADHVIADTAAFRTAVEKAVAAAKADRLVTFGVVARYAETGYGYIERGADEGAWSAVERFVEKPDRETAERYIASGRFFWNSGMFVFRAGTFSAELERLAPAIHRACEAAAGGAVADGDFTRLGLEFLECPPDSIDYAVMEKTDRAAVVGLDAGWNDVGSWAALYDVLEADADGNVLRGDAVTLDSTNCLVVTDSRKVALLGIDDAVVVDAGDCLLVLRKSRSQDVKSLLQKHRADSDENRNR